MEFNQESNDEQNSHEETMAEESDQSGAKQWFQDNLRIIVSIFIVIVIAAGIYSYSNRSQNVDQKEQAQQSDVLKDLTKNDDGKTDTQAKSTDNANTKTDKTSSVTTSQETDQSFIETAGKGDGTTKLARKALADYLEKNPDSSLAPEHKIYIEDYLRKNVGHKGGVKVGTSVEFSKSLIGDAISKSKNLSAGQLKNLHKYAVRVPSLS